MFRASTNARQSASCPLLLIVLATRHTPFVTSLADEIYYLKSRYLRALSGWVFLLQSNVDTLRCSSIPYQLEKTPVFFADLAGFLECASALRFKAAKVILNARNIFLKILPDDARIFPNCPGIAWHERPSGCKARSREALAWGEHHKCHGLHCLQDAQPQVSDTPIFLDRRQWPCLEFE